MATCDSQLNNIFAGVDAKESHLTQSGRCPMQKPFAFSPADKIAQHFILTRRQILIIAVASAILLSMISLEFLNMQYGESHSVGRSSLSSSSELSTGMPLP
jgi:hypothetical protein